MRKLSVLYQDTKPFIKMIIQKKKLTQNIETQKIQSWSNKKKFGKHNQTNLHMKVQFASHSSQSGCFLLKEISGNIQISILQYFFMVKTTIFTKAEVAVFDEW